MTQVPMLVIDELEVWEVEVLLYEGGQLLLYRICPMTYEDDKFVDVP